MGKNVPSQPTLFDMPFAGATADKTVIPTSTTSAGKASLENGFPVECSAPLEDGGIPPVRTDFNGILNLLSSWIFYQQSGGIAQYDTSVNYIVPGLVYYNGVVYTCLKDNGPASAGVQVPGAVTSSEYWVAGLGNLGINISGNNANMYLVTGTSWIDDDQATINFPTTGVGGFLTVSSHELVVHQCMALRTSQTQMWTRTSANGGATWTPWVKMLFASDVYNGAYTQIFMRTDAPNDAIGKDGDLWFQYI